MSDLTYLKELAKARFTSFLVATFEVFYLYHPILLPKNVFSAVIAAKQNTAKPC